MTAALVMLPSCSPPLIPPQKGEDSSDPASSNGRRVVKTLKN